MGFDPEHDAESRQMSFFRGVDMGKKKMGSHENFEIWDEFISGVRRLRAQDTEFSKTEVVQDLPPEAPEVLVKSESAEIERRVRDKFYASPSKELVESYFWDVHPNARINDRTLEINLENLFSRLSLVHALPDSVRSRLTVRVDIGDPAREQLSRAARKHNIDVDTVFWNVLNADQRAHFL